jgi:protein phosphatase
MMQCRFHAATDPGRVRANNEDAVDFDATCALALLADGMGGHNAGEVASAMATQLIKSAMVRYLSADDRRPDTDQTAQVLQRCVEQTNQSVLQAGNSNPEHAGMGTTLVVGVFQDWRLILAHVGDSRCYRLRAGVLEQLTKDHSVLQTQVDAGLLTAVQAALAPGRHLLTRALGVVESIKVELHEHAVKPGDMYLLCSDGLTDMVGDRDIGRVLSGNTAMPSMATALVDRANAAGGRDNISVLLVNLNRLNGKKPGLLARRFGISESF